MAPTATFVGGPLDGQTATLFGYPPANRYRGDDGLRGNKTYTLEQTPTGLVYRHHTWQEPQPPELEDAELHVEIVEHAEPTPTPRPRKRTRRNLENN